jgi:hypothetical protein
MDRRLIFRPRRFNNCLDVEPLHYLILAHLSAGCVRPEGRLPTCYSPVRHSSYNIATVRQVDLHVLSTPPAFVLSQDQTLHSKLNFGKFLYALRHSSLAHCIMYIFLVYFERTEFIQELQI